MRGATALRTAAAAAAVLLASGLTPAYAHGWIFPHESPWVLWQLTPELTLPTVLVLVLYWAGVRKRRQQGHPVGAGRQIAYYAGVLSIFLSLQGPFDAMADRSFAMHQIEHLLLRMVGPMLLALSAPIAELLLGVPPWGRRWVVRPIARRRSVRLLYSVSVQPLVATLVFNGALYFWQLPHYHDLAILDDGVHDLMHFTMLWSGLFFFWMLLDPRPRSRARTSFGMRFTLLVLSLLAEIALGALITFKSQVWYPAYDLWGRLWALGAMTDERWGGLIIWIPSAMMGVITGLLMLRLLLILDQQSDRARRRRRAGSAAALHAPGLPAEPGALP